MVFPEEVFNKDPLTFMMQCRWLKQCRPCEHHACICFSLAIGEELRWNVTSNATDDHFN